MFSTIQKIRWQLFRGYLHVGSHIHVRHWRGGGIHSPFMYGIVRHVFMKRRITGTDHRLYEALVAIRVKHENAVLLQNLFTYRHMDQFSLVRSETEAAQVAQQNGHLLCILPPRTAPQVIRQQAHLLSERSGTLVVLSPHRSPQSWCVARKIIEQYPCVSVDRGVMMIYIFNPKLQAQHYRI